MIAQQFMDPELLIIIGCIIVALILIVYFCVSRVQKNEFSDSNITYVIRR